jgi:hypothetical protein
MIKKTHRRPLHLGSTTVRLLDAQLAQVQGGLMSLWGCQSITSYNGNQCVPSVDIYRCG